LTTNLTNLTNARPDHRRLSSPFVPFVRFVVKEEDGAAAAPPGG